MRLAFAGILLLSCAAAAAPPAAADNAALEQDLRILRWVGSLALQPQQMEEWTAQAQAAARALAETRAKLDTPEVLAVLTEMRQTLLAGQRITDTQRVALREARRLALGLDEDAGVGDLGDILSQAVAPAAEAMLAVLEPRQVILASDEDFIDRADGALDELRDALPEALERYQERVDDVAEWLAGDRPDAETIKADFADLANEVRGLPIDTLLARWEELRSELTEILLPQDVDEDTRDEALWMLRSTLLRSDRLALCLADLRAAQAAP